ncbi:MAG: thiamine diphosphokinase [Bacillota bacterium]|nr:MAG: thiamine diphosphokinase [Bacillota bacterium]
MPGKTGEPAAAAMPPFGFLDDGSEPHAVVVAGGNLGAPELRAEAERLVATAAFCVAADGGLRLLRAVGRWPDVLVGDFDTLSRREVEEAEAAGVTVLRFPTAKDATDSELALDLVEERGGPRRVYLIGGVGDRMDHTLANLMMAARLCLEGRDVTIIAASAHIAPLVGPGRVCFSGRPGQPVSLIPLTPCLTGVTTEGLVYPLKEATLRFGTTLAVSNELAGERGAFSARAGRALVVLQRRP